MSFVRNNAQQPLKSNTFLNPSVTEKTLSANRAVEVNKPNLLNMKDKLVDKLLSPVVTGVVGCAFIMITSGVNMLSVYGIKKFLEFSLTAAFADYVGNMIFEGANLYKNSGIRRVENLIVEPLIGGLSYYALNRFVLGLSNGLMFDFILGSSITFAGTLTGDFVRMTFK